MLVLFTRRSPGWHRRAALAVSVSLALGACAAHGPAPVVQATLVPDQAQGPCGQLSNIPQPADAPDQTVITPTVDSLLADMRNKQALDDCRQANRDPAAPTPTPTPTPTPAPAPAAAAEPPPVVPNTPASVPPPVLVTQTQPQATQVTAVPPSAVRPSPPLPAPPSDDGLQPAMRATIDQSWLSAQQLLNQPNSNKETQALYVVLCKSGDRSSCLMAQALGLQIH